MEFSWNNVFNKKETSMMKFVFWMSTALDSNKTTTSIDYTSIMDKAHKYLESPYVSKMSLLVNDITQISRSRSNQEAISKWTEFSLSNRYQV